MGVDCDDAAGCTSDFCATVVENAPFDFDRCSECAVDEDCATGSCVPTWVAGIEDMYLGCVEDGANENGKGCVIESPGVGEGTTCVSGICAVAPIFMDASELGICSECAEDLDCGDGGICTPASFSQEGAVPAVCE